MFKALSRPLSLISILLSGTLAAQAEGLLMPDFDAELGRGLFAAKGCVVCHAVNGIGGIDAPALDYDSSQGPMNPFDFAAKMWRGAETMIYMQQDEMGGQIDLTGPELAAIIAFAHDPDEQGKFSMDDLPDAIADMLHEADDGHQDGEADGDHDDTPDSEEAHD